MHGKGAPNLLSPFVLRERGLSTSVLQNQAWAPNLVHDMDSHVPLYLSAHIPALIVTELPFEMPRCHGVA